MTKKAVKRLCRQARAGCANSLDYFLGELRWHGRAQKLFGRTLVVLTFFGGVFRLCFG